MPNFDWEDFSKPLVEGLALYEGKWGGIPFDIPIFITMYRKDLLEKHGIEVPVMPFPAPPRQLIRISAQAYNSEDQFARLATALRAELQLA